MMSVDDGRAAQRTEQTRRDRMRGVAAQPAKRGQRSDAQSAGLLHDTAPPTERDQLAVDLSSQRSRQLEWITLAAAE